MKNPLVRNISVKRIKIDIFLTAVIIRTMLWKEPRVAIIGHYPPTVSLKNLAVLSLLLAGHIALQRPLSGLHAVFPSSRRTIRRNAQGSTRLDLCKRTLPHLLPSVACFSQRQLLSTPLLLLVRCSKLPTKRPLLQMQWTENGRLCRGGGWSQLASHRK